MENKTTTVIKKINDQQIEVTKTTIKPPEVSKIIYSYGELLDEKKRIQEQKEQDNIQRDLELKEIDKLIDECEKYELKLPEVENN